MAALYTVSDGSKRTAENCIHPTNDRTAIRPKNPACVRYRWDISTYSTVRRDGDNRALRGTQWVDATSVGCSLKAGESVRVVRKMKGQRTISLGEFISVAQKVFRRCSTHGTDPQLVVTTRSGRLPTGIQSSVVKSHPISSHASRIAAAQSSSSSGSLLPPGSATWPVHLSPAREARFMKSASGTPCCTQGCAKKSSRRSSADSVGSVVTGSVGQCSSEGRIRIIKATEARFLHPGGFGICGYGR